MATFNGFPKQYTEFFTNLVENNNREWFEAHKQDYIDCIQTPTQAFVEALGQRLKEISDGIQFDTRTNGTGSMMRIYRDIRFSKDKTPYKTYQGIVFWQGARKKKENPGFFLGIVAEGIGLHVGQHGFPRDMIADYQAAVDDKKRGAELEAILDKINDYGEYVIEGEQYKRVPRGYDADHPRGDLLKYKGLHASLGHIDPAIVTSPEIVDVCFEHCRRLAPLQQWLVGVN